MTGRIKKTLRGTSSSRIDYLSPRWEDKLLKGSSGHVSIWRTINQNSGLNVFISELGLGTDLTTTNNQSFTMSNS